MIAAIDPTLASDEARHSEPSPPDEPPRWFIRKGIIDHGPVPWNALQEMARDGQLRPTDLVRRTDSDRWTKACEAHHEPPPAPKEVIVRPMRTIEPAIAHRLASALAADSAAAAEPARAYQKSDREREASSAENRRGPTSGSSSPEVPSLALPARHARSVSPPSDPRHAGPALLALALSIVGLFALALPLGMLSLYLGGNAAWSLRRSRIGPAMVVALLAVGVASVDVGVSLWTMIGRLGA